MDAYTVMIFVTLLRQRNFISLEWRPSFSILLLDKKNCDIFSKDYGSYGKYCGNS